MQLRRKPRPELLPFVESIWFANPAGGPGHAQREHVLPTGNMHIAIRLFGEPIRIFGDVSGATAVSHGHAVVGGARATPYAKLLSVADSSVGAVLRPGASLALFGVPAMELSHRHTPLDALWGNAAGQWRERILHQLDPMRQLETVEGLLLASINLERTLHPAVAPGLRRIREGASIAAVAAESGYSHRRFNALFREAVGLSAKRRGRLYRFQQALALISDGRLPLAEVAIAAGYSDQAHFNREFREFAGFAPGTYRELRPALRNHVPAPKPRQA